MEQVKNDTWIIVYSASVSLRSDEERFVSLWWARPSKRFARRLQLFPPDRCGALCLSLQLPSLRGTVSWPVLQAL